MGATDDDWTVAWADEEPVNGHTIGIYRRKHSDRLSVVCDCGGFERSYSARNLLVWGEPDLLLALFAAFADHAA